MTDSEIERELSRLWEVTYILTNRSDFLETKIVLLELEIQQLQTKIAKLQKKKAK